MIFYPVGFRYYAHTLPGRAEEEWQELQAHLEGVSKHAAASGASFHAGDWARVAGLWHDLGKYSDAFQSYLRTASSPDPHIADAPHATGRIDHSTAGAQHAATHIDILGHLLAYSIAGHHSGLLDGRGSGSCLEARLAKAVEPWNHAPKAIASAPALELPVFVAKALGGRDAFSVAFFVRMVFSCLVDADFLDTEQFMNPEQAAERPTWPSDVLTRMEACLDAHMTKLKSGSTPVNVERCKVREDCLAAAVQRPGLFSLTVPTGGGKTLSSLAFALRHAQRHGLRRVVYVVPFTTITEQIAEQFRHVMQPLGDGDPVVEHHSNLDAGSETTASRLATENWDAPLVVTTAVQFYDSLFAARPSRCRKLHNLAKAVIVLDEAQTLPVDYLDPCLRVLRVLLQGLGSRARIRWVDLVTRPIRTPCGSAASARPRRPSPSIAPVPLRSACMISMPRKVRHAVVNRLKPSIGRVRRLMNRWSCSMMLFRYLHWRRFERGRTSPSCRTASNATG